MLNPNWSRILHEVLSLPTAPFAEHNVMAYVQAFCAARPALKLTCDPSGNLLIHVHRGGARVSRPVCLTAHMDHPGFVADRMIQPQRLRAYWRGGVPIEYFEGAKVRFQVDGRWIKGRVESTRPVREHEKLRVDTTVVAVPREVPPGSIGMWDFPDPQIRGNRVFARGCDDLAGLAGILCCLDELTSSRKPCDAWVLFTRAEEVGFVGAIASCRHETVPRRCVLVTVETSSVLPHAPMGEGPILRVGDKTTAFTPAATAFCRQVAEALAAKDPAFRFQRKLMDGGTCEASAFCQFGYEATGLCMALGNYHNVDRRRKKLAPEYVDVGDFENLVKWFIALVRWPKAYDGLDGEFRKRLDAIERSYKVLLRDSLHLPR